DRTVTGVQTCALPICITGSMQAGSVQAFDKKDMWQPGQSDAPHPVTGHSYQFFTIDEVSFMDKLVDCIIPPDDLGPGAQQAGVKIGRASCRERGKSGV